MAGILQSSALANSRRLADEVALGAHGMLFHRFDWAFEQIGGRLPLDDEQCRRWVDLLSRRQATCEAIGARLVTLVIPERHVVYEDCLPPDGHVSEARPFMRLREALSGALAAGLLYPQRALCAARAERAVYYRTDQHLTDDGGYAVYRELHAHLGALLGAPVPVEALDRRQSRLLGDLGVRLDGEPDEVVDYLGLRQPRARKVVSTQLPVGRIDVYESDDASLPRCVWFGDSHSFALLPYVVGHFSRLVTVQTTRLLEDLVAREAPHVVVSQLSELQIAYPQHKHRHDVVRLPQDGATEGLEALYARGGLNGGRRHLTIDFGRAGNHAAFCRKGWSAPEDTQRWSEGDGCAVEVPAPPGDASWRMLLDVSPYLIPVHHETQRLIVRLNGQEIARLVLSGQEPVSLELPRHAVGLSGTCLIEFLHPDARSPAEFGGGDARRLGLAFRSLTICS